MGNLSISNTTYAAQPQTTTGKTEQRGLENKPDTIYNVQNIAYKNDTIYNSKEKHEQKLRQEQGPDEVIFTTNDGITTVYASPKAQYKRELNNIALNICRATDGIGTDNELFERTLKQINTDNILEVIERWDSLIGKEYGETFIESFLGDANLKQRQTYGNQLIKALYERVTGDNKPDDPNIFEHKLISEFLKLNEANFFPDKKKMAELFNALATGKGKEAFYESLKSN